MPELLTNDSTEPRHSDDMQDIITAVPSWIVRWGITLFFFVLFLIFSLSTFIRYPDIVKTPIKIQSPNSPKLIIAKSQGKLVKLLVKENDTVIAGQPMAYLESTANHDAVLKLLDLLRQIQKQINLKKSIGVEFANQGTVPEYGELQVTYQDFFQTYLNYRSAVDDGFYLKKKTYLQNDLKNLHLQQDQLIAQKDIQQKDYALAGQEFGMHQKLEEQKVETTAEFREAQSKYLSKKAPLVQTDAAIISAKGNYAAKEKEILELDNQIEQEKAKFSQALNGLISQTEEWKNKYVLIASQNGRANYAGIIQENQIVKAGQEVFYVNPGVIRFYGEMAIPQENMGKVKEGQEVIIKLKSYPFEQYGMIRGRIKFISEVPYQDSIFLSKVNFTSYSDMKKPIHLKQGMAASAEIITQDATVLQRITWNFVRLLNNR